MEGQSDAIRVIMNYAIAQDFSVDVNGCKSHDLHFLIYIKLASGPQPRVKNNGPTINLRVMYTARGARTVNIPFNIGDDLLAREDIESYQVALSNPSDAMVILGTSATINIYDTDCKCLFISICLDDNFLQLSILLLKSLDMFFLRTQDLQWL